MSVEIKCPHCNRVFNMDEDVAGHIREQVRTKAFEKELSDRLNALRKGYEAEAKLSIEQAVSAERRESEKKLAGLRAEVVRAQSAADKAKSDSEVAEASIQSRIADAVAAEHDRYQEKIDKLYKEINDAKSAADKAKSDLSVQEAEHKFAVQQAVLDTRAEFSEKMTLLEADKRSLEYERDFYKDLKARMSTKMVGETLEQHCETEFNKIRMTAFPLAEFGKDNTVSSQSGSKGDYIFREYDEEGNEIISIMFEMKNEADETATKKKNEHFFKELDKDRREKNCEYAVLVSLLEADDEFYNQGIVDVSYRYEKMYVIRPQFFITIISLLRNAVLRSLDARRELRRMQEQDIDLLHFEENLTDFKNKFSYNYEQASKRFNEAIDEIDKTIDHLQKVKAGLLASGRQLRLANDKVDNVTIRKLTADSPSIRKQLENASANG